MKEKERRDHRGMFTSVEVVSGLKWLFRYHPPEQTAFFDAWYEAFNRFYGPEAGNYVWWAPNWDGDDQADWNPPRWQGLKPPPFEHAPPKPTFEQIITAYREWVLLEEASVLPPDGRGVHSRLAELREAAKARVGDAAIDLDAEAVHVGSGLEHMTGLMHLAEDGNLAGNHLPPVRLRDAQHAPRDVWLAREVRKLLGAVADRENRMESAHNVLVRKRMENVEAIKDATLPIAEREAAFDYVQDLDSHYAERLSAEMAKYDPDALPSDVETLRALYVERLEAHAMGRTKYLMKAATQQGVDRGPSCVDEERAVQEVAKQCVIGTLEIEATESAADAKSAFDAAKAAIDIVEALNIPVWHIGAEKWIASGAEVSRSGRTVTVSARHPIGATIAGRVTIGIFSAYYEDGSAVFGTRFTRTAVPGDAKGHRAVITLRQGETRTVVVDVFARNLCGPSKFTVKLSP